MYARRGAETSFLDKDRAFILMRSIYMDLELAWWGVRLHAAHARSRGGDGAFEMAIQLSLGAYTFCRLHATIYNVAMYDHRGRLMFHCGLSL